MAGPRTVRVYLDDDHRQALKRLSRKRSVSERVRERARIVLACDVGSAPTGWFATNSTPT